MKNFILMSVLYLISGCAEYPSDAKFYSHGFFLKNYFLDLPKVSFSKDAVFTFNFKNVGFNFGSKSIVKLVVSPSNSVFLSDLDKLITVEVWQVKESGRVLVFRQSSRLNDSLSKSEKTKETAWQLGFSNPPLAPLAGDMEFVGFANFKYGTNLTVDISRFSSYQVILTIHNKPGLENVNLSGFVRISSSWK